MTRARLTQLLEARRAFRSCEVADFVLIDELDRQLLAAEAALEQLRKDADLTERRVAEAKTQAQIVTAIELAGPLTAVMRKWNGLSPTQLQLTAEAQLLVCFTDLTDALRTGIIKISKEQQ